MTDEIRWTNGKIMRLRRHLATAYEKHGEGGECKAVAEVADQFDVSSSQVREVIGRSERNDEAKRAVYARAASAAAGTSTVDIYCLQRGAIIERLEKGLHPHSLWRDPREPWAPGQPKSDPVPFAHTLAGACVWLRKRQTGRHDVSAELLWCLVVRENCEAEAETVRCALVSAWLDMHASIAILARTQPGLCRVERAAATLVAMCVTGIQMRSKPPLQWKQWWMLRESGERMLWGLADRAARRAAEALR